MTSSTDTTGLPRIDAVYEGSAGEPSLRFTAARGAKEHARPGRQPIDVCVRDGGSGEILLPPQLSGDAPLIEGCDARAAMVGDAGKRTDTILEALGRLAKVRFKPEYRSEYIAILNLALIAAPPDQALLELGNGVIIHERKPPLPPAVDPPH